MSFRLAVLASVLMFLAGFGVFVVAPSWSSLLCCIVCVVSGLLRVFLIAPHAFFSACWTITRNRRLRQLYWRTLRQNRRDPRSIPHLFLIDMRQREHEMIQRPLELIHCAEFGQLLDRRHGTPYGRRKLAVLDQLLFDGERPFFLQLEFGSLTVPGIAHEYDEWGYPRPVFPGHVLTIVRHSRERFQILQCFIFRLSARYAQQQGYMRLRSRREMRQWVRELGEFLSRDRWDAGTEVLARRLFHAGCPNLMGGVLRPVDAKHSDLYLGFSFGTVSTLTRADLDQVFLPFANVNLESSR